MLIGAMVMRIDPESAFFKVAAVIFALAGLLSITASSAAQPSKPMREQLVGTWQLVSIISTRVDGTKYELFGPQANGLLIFDSNGRYSLQIFRRGRTPFAGGRMEGTQEENRAAVQGMISHFGTYTLNETDHAITFHIESSSYPNWDGTDQTRSIVNLVDRLSWSDPAPLTGPQSSDLQSDLVWRRVSSEH
jgi:hypothetical protein